MINGKTISLGLGYDFDKLNILISNKFDKTTKLATPEEVAISRKGICHEIALFIAYNLKKANIPYKVLMFTTKHKRSGGICTHAYTTWKEGDKWCIRNSDNDDEGPAIEEAESIEGLIAKLDAVFSGIESPILEWKAMELQKWTYTYGEWVNLL